jgi:hypothetical protein
MMDQQTAFNLAAALTESGYNVQMSSSAADTDDHPTDFRITLAPSQGGSLEDLAHAQKIIDRNNAVLELPGFNIVTKQEIDARATEEVRLAEAAAAQEKSMQEQLEAAKSIGGGAEKDGGKAVEPEQVTAADLEAEPAP